MRFFRRAPKVEDGEATTSDEPAAETDHLAIEDEERTEQALERTKKSWFGNISGIFSRGDVDEELWEELLDEWIEVYNARHLNRDTGCTPAERLEPSAARPLEGSPDDIFCLKEERKVAKDHTISLAGVTYTLPSDPVLVASRRLVRAAPTARPTGARR